MFFNVEYVVFKNVCSNFNDINSDMTSRSFTISLYICKILHICNMELCLRVILSVIFTLCVCLCEKVYHSWGLRQLEFWGESGEEGGGLVGLGEAKNG